MEIVIEEIWGLEKEVDYEGFWWGKGKDEIWGEGVEGEEWWGEVEMEVGWMEGVEGRI